MKLLLIVCSLWSIEAFASTVPFRDMATQALQSNATLEQSRLTIAQRESATKGARWSLLPRVELGSSRTHSRSKDGVTNWQTSTNLSANINLFDGFSSWQRLETAEITLDKARTDNLVARRQTLATLASHYLTWQRDHRKLDFIKQLDEARRRTKETIERLVKSGGRSNVDGLLYDNLVLRSEERVLRAEVEFKHSYLALQGLFGEEAQTQIGDSEPQDTDIFTSDYCAKPIEYAKHPTVLTLEQQGQQLASQRQATGGDYWPSVDLGAQRQLAGLSSENANGSDTVRLSLTWELFSGLSTRYEQADLAYEIDKVKSRKNDVMKDLRLLQTENCQKLSMTAQLVNKTRKIADNYEKLLATSRRQFQNGGISTLDLTDQELDLLDAKLSLIDAQFDHQAVLAEQWIIHDATLDSLAASKK